MQYVRMVEKCDETEATHSLTTLITVKHGEFA